MENTKKLRAKVAQDDKQKTKEVFLLIKMLKVASWQLHGIKANPPFGLKHQVKAQFNNMKTGIDRFLVSFDSVLETDNSQIAKKSKDYQERHEDFLWQVIETVDILPIEMHKDFLTTLAEAVEIYAEAALKIKAEQSDKEIDNE
jgi:hypothetical protein